jgi:hypothetical protein
MIMLVYYGGLCMYVCLYVRIDDGYDDCGGIGKFRSGLPLLQLLHQHFLISSSMHTINTVTITSIITTMISLFYYL